MNPARDRSGCQKHAPVGYLSCMEIEVFRAGNAAANAAGITAADLADIAAFDCAAHPVPNVIGHPLTDSPARDRVVKFRAEGNSLFADVPEASPAFAPVVEGIRKSEILNRSMAFFGKSHPSNPTPGKLAPKHLGFLGGAAPGVFGMPPLAQSFAFSADDALSIAGDPAPAVVFEAAPTAVITFTEPPAAPAAPTLENTNVTEAEQLAADKAKFEADKAEHDAKVAAFAADQATARKTANAATVDGLVAATKVLPSDRDALVEAFNAAEEGQVLAFASDATKAVSPVSIIAGILAKGGNVVELSADPLSPTFAAPTDATAAAAALEKVRADKRANYGK